MIQNRKSKPVTSEEIKGLVFVNMEAAFTKQQINERDLNLYRGMLLGNNFQRKVRIVFETIEGLFQVETTIWAKTEKNVVLKGGTYIPVNAIRTVDII